MVATPFPKGLPSWQTLGEGVNHDGSPFEMQGRKPRHKGYSKMEYPYTTIKEISMDSEDELNEAPESYDEPTELDVIEQVEVPVLEEIILAALGADGEAYIPIRPFAMKLGIAKPERQLDRIRRDDTLRACMRKMTLDTAGGRQTLQCLRVDMFAVWIIGIRESMCKEDVRLRLSAYKREAAKAIIEHFRALAIARQARAVAPAASTQLAEMDADGTVDEVVAYHEAMMRYHQEQRDLALWKAHQEEQVGQLRGDVQQTQAAMRQAQADIVDLQRVTALVPEIVTHYRNRTLSDAHQSTVAACVKRIHDLTGRSQASIYEDLRFMFRVAKYDRIPDARWTEVAAYLFGVVHAAGGKTDDLETEQGHLFGE